jgi:uncharacterized protein YhbP (UPF0306 family)
MSVSKSALPTRERLLAARDFLAAHHVMSLGLHADGIPHGCSLMFVHDDFVLSWMSDPASRHSGIIDAAGEARAAVTIAPDYDDFRDIRGLQMTGVASRPRLVDAAMAIAPFARRYAFFNVDKPAALAAAMAKAAIYRFTPTRITFVDNTAGFGNTTTFSADDLAEYSPLGGA